MTKMLTTNDVAEALNLSPRFVRKLAANGDLPGQKFGTVWRFREGDIRAVVEGDDQ